MLVEFPIGRSFYKINCEEDQKENVLRLASRLNQRVNKLSLNLHSVDEKTLLVTSALMIEEELESLDSSRNADDEQSFNEQDLYDAVSENMENVADYVESLTKKIKNY